MKLPRISISEYSYELPQEKIAAYPHSERDKAKLLVYNEGLIHHKQFSDLPGLLPKDSLLIFNDTKVIPARLYFKKETGAAIEIFLLNPVEPSGILSFAMTAQRKCVWKCAIGNAKRWPAQMKLILNSSTLTLEARILDRKDSLVEFTWNPQHMPFAEVLHIAGAVPLPPYLHREAEQSDEQRYQTVYSRHEGAVAAPTAGLHFTDAVLTQLKDEGIRSDFVTLHVSAGTFLPVKTSDAMNHIMHEEQIVIQLETLQNLLKAPKVIAVGTTAMRTLESVYWFGVALLKDSKSIFSVSSFEPYQDNDELPGANTSIKAVLKHMQSLDIKELNGVTSIFIFPGYKFRICQGLITNFHQPGSTLLLLIAAWLGPAWKKLYKEALQHNYRFLSYGDSSLLFPNYNI